MPAPFPTRLRVVSLVLALAALIAGVSYLVLPSPLSQRPGSAFLVIPLAVTAWIFITAGASIVAGHLPLIPWMILRIGHAIGGSLYASYAVALILYAFFSGSTLTGGVHALALAVTHFAVLVAIPKSPKGGS